MKGRRELKNSLWLVTRQANRVLAEIQLKPLWKSTKPKANFYQQVSRWKTDLRIIKQTNKIFKFNSMKKLIDEFTAVQRKQVQVKTELHQTMI